MKKRDLKARIAYLETEIAELRQRLELANYLLDLWYPYPRQYPAVNVIYPESTAKQIKWPNYTSGRTDDELIRWDNVQSII